MSLISKVQNYFLDMKKDMMAESKPNLTGSIGAILGYLVYSAITGNTVSPAEVGVVSSVSYFLPNLYRDIKENWKNMSNGKNLVSAIIENIFSAGLAGTIGGLTYSFLQGDPLQITEYKEMLKSYLQEIGKAGLATTLATYGTTFVKTAVEEPLGAIFKGVSDFLGYMAKTRKELS
ncbi:MAG: hypothetical protein QXE31_00500 [Candidatus Woesearchaeota archaeon]